MNKNDDGMDKALNLDGLRACLFLSAKAYWGWGLAVAHLAIISVPTAKYVEGPDWLGPLVAGVLLLVGKALVFRAEMIRADAEQLHRANEFESGIGKPPDNAAVADLQSRYDRLEQKARDRQPDEEGYYEESDLPKGALRLAKMISESAWWTHQLAAKACKVMACVAVVLVLVSILIVVVVAHGAHPTQLLTAYTIVICLLIMSESVILCARYWQLNHGAKRAFDRIRAFVEEGADVTSAVLTTNDYQMVRSNGPLIPDWFRKRHKSALQRVWNRTLSHRHLPLP